MVDITEESIPLDQLKPLFKQFDKEERWLLAEKLHKVYGKKKSVTWKRFASVLEREADKDESARKTLFWFCFMVGAELPGGPN